ncbi:fibrinogen-like protein A [Dysidea avara]|uniref:fibrinogen-like protein A n=1 Tax=Dysidea avara TaxID=196820 RepID=UPI003321D80B
MIVVTTVITVLVLVSATTVDGSVIDNCCSVTAKGNYFATKRPSPGIYTIRDPCSTTTSGHTAQGYCDTLTDGGGWIVIQRRIQGVNEDFNRFWWEYELGFGNLQTEFWYGLHSLHCLTSKGQWELWIDLTFSNGTDTYLHYNHFSVGSPSTNYTLSISGFTGITPIDPFITEPLNGQPFTTRDKDNDDDSYTNCAINGHGSNATGGWWHKNCYHINLNYNYAEPYGFIYLGKGYQDPPFVEMKIRQMGCIA